MAAAGYPPPRCPRRRQGPKVRRKSLEKTISISCQQFKPLLPDALSHFSLSRVTVGDSGNYSCRAAGLREEATVNVHVLVDGEIAEKYQICFKLIHLSISLVFLYCDECCIRHQTFFPLFLFSYNDTVHSTQIFVLDRLRPVKAPFFYCFLEVLQYLIRIKDTFYPKKHFFLLFSLRYRGGEAYIH